ncbi:MAG TPA: C40 family peptidase [Mycobacteriales bacterium]|nr:C40 family peptidase [Mycobacteriales bacterium]
MPVPSGPSSSATVLPAAVRRRRFALIRSRRLDWPVIGLSLAIVAGIGTAVVAAPSSSLPKLASLPATAAFRDQRNASIDDADLHLAAVALVDQAVASGVLAAAPANLATEPAAAIVSAVYATLQQARTDDPSLQPRDTRSLVGATPFNLVHQIHIRARHPNHPLTHALRLFGHAVAVGVSRGLGLDRSHDAVFPAQPQHADGVYVDPVLPALPAHATVAMVAIRAAMTRLGDPYVWAAAGPDTFDCSGLVRWAFGKAGLRLLHYTGYQWEEGRLIPARDALPGDLVLFYRDLSHVGIYLGSGWMLNAPYTGQYVNVVPVHGKVAGIVRP